jgi:hypothetical protein
MAIDDQRLAGLARTKLLALLRGAFPDAHGTVESFNAGVGSSDGGRAFVYLTAPSTSPLGAALAWGSTRGARELHVIADDPEPVLAVQAMGLDPAAQIWRVVGTELVAVAAASLPPPPVLPQDALAMAETLAGAGCDVVVEHGVMVGEILGLEVARVAIDWTGSPTVRVGVGLYDQEAHELMNASTTLEQRLAAVVDEVRTFRRPGAQSHPLNRVARERWLRSVLLSDPGALGLESIDAVAPLAPRRGIRESHPAAAMGRVGEELVVVVASCGIDLDLVPVAAGHLARTGADRVVLVLPERDHHDVIRRQASYLAAPSALVAVPDPWDGG